jgi:hypothetical protein
MASLSGYQSRPLSNFVPYPLAEIGDKTQIARAIAQNLAIFFILMRTPLPERIFFRYF